MIYMGSFHSYVRDEMGDVVPIYWESEQFPVTIGR